MVVSPHAVVIGACAGISLAIFHEFWAVAASRNSSRAPGAAKPQSVKAENAFEVGEQHLDLLSLTARDGVGVGPGNGARAFFD